MRFILRILQAARALGREKCPTILFYMVPVAVIAALYGLLSVFGCAPELEAVAVVAAPLLLVACFAALVMWEDDL